MTHDTHADLPEQPPEDQVERLADIIGLDLVPLSVGELPILSTEQGPRIAFRHAVQALGLDYSAQWRRIRARRWASVVVTATELRNGRRLRMVTVDIPTFMMWLATIPETRVRAELRPVLEAYQLESKDVLYRYWTRGLAVNPRGRTPEQIQLIENVASVAAGAVWDNLARWHYYDQMLRGLRDSPNGGAATTEDKATARRKCQALARKAFDALTAGGGLELGNVLHDETEQESVR